MRNIDWEAIETKWGGMKLEVPEEVKNLYENDIDCYPSEDNLFTAFFNCSFDKVRVVIIGQDPYPGEGEADGMAFSMKTLKKKDNPKNSIEHYIIPRLKKVYPEGEYSDDCGDLSKWATQGVLLLNSALSYVPSNVIKKRIKKKNKELDSTNKRMEKFQKIKSNQQEVLNLKKTNTKKYQEAKKKETNAETQISKCKIEIDKLEADIADLKNKKEKCEKLKKEGNPWKELISKVLVKINGISDRKICFLLWGGNAEKIFNNAVEKPNHIVLTCAHPSPKAKGANFPFAKNHHFTTVNLIQSLQNEEEIDWSIPGPKK